MRKIGVYIGIPFCKKKCYYCDFISFAGKESFIEKYIQKLLEEIDKRQNKEYLVETIYFGGGTPSIIHKKYIDDILKKIRKCFNVSEKAEITIEINPGTVNKEKLEKYYQIGINRISIGLQVTQDDLLKTIGRIHTYKQFLDTYTNARNIGFKNINVDLMIGIPFQTMENVKESLNEIINIVPEHISVYSLIIEPNTIMEEKILKKEYILPSEEIERKMYDMVKKTLEKNGYMQYEISNFALKGFESKHNTDCWKQKEYLGFGVGASSYFNMKRFSNTESLEEYLENEKPILHEIQNKLNQEKEFMLLGLRMIKGVSISEFKNKFVDNPIFIFRKELEKLVKQNLIEIDENFIKLTRKGLDLANLVWEEFV